MGRGFAGRVYLEPEVPTRAAAVAVAGGDSVVLVNYLPVKGSSMVAKGGTVVRDIGLVRDNPYQIGGRVKDQQIILLCQFVRKSA
jgi:protein PhnA